jgi:hypothetical protein
MGGAGGRAHGLSPARGVTGYKRAGGVRARGGSALCRGTPVAEMLTVNRSLVSHQL